MDDMRLLSIEEIMLLSEAFAVFTKEKSRSLKMAYVTSNLLLKILNLNDYLLTQLKSNTVKEKEKEKEKESSGIIKHAIQEFKAAGWLYGTDEWVNGAQESICKHLLELLSVFSSFGHSGTTACYTILNFKILANQEPIASLTGKDIEWREVNGSIRQNKRCSHVFKGKDGRSYDIDVPSLEDKKYYIEFPYTPGR